MRARAIGFARGVRAKDVKSVYYLVTFLANFSVSMTYAVFVLYMVNIGLDLFQVMLVNVAFMAGTFVFEIPTGAYADYFGRKNSIILSQILMATSLFIWFSSTTVWLFIVAQLLGALAFTFSSGALDAWMVDSIGEKEHAGHVDHVFSHTEIIGNSASLFGGLAGAYIGAVNLAYPFGVAAVIALVALAVSVMFIHENRIHIKALRLGEGAAHMAQVARHSIQYGLKHKVVLWLMFSTVLSTFAFQPLNMYWAPHMNSLAGDKVWLMGWVWAGMCLFMIVGAIIVRWLLKREKSYAWILVATSLYLAIPIFISSLSNIFAIALSSFLIYEIGRGMQTPAHKAFLNKYIPGEQRATILSFDSMMGKLGAVIGLLFFGWIGKTYSIQAAWFVSALALILLIPVYLRARRHERHL